ncbi:MAG TPA: hypothetical protein VMG63_22910 [Terriglobia bacterium]|nr:hypothetical protein [Terriglobia bacterium]
MKVMLRIGLAATAVLVNAHAPQALFAQACKDEQAMIDEFKQGLVTTVDAVKKESLDNFERAFHQKSCLTKLTLAINAMDEVLSCLDKASQDASATKEQVTAYKAQKESDAKLKEKMTQYKSQLKAIEAPKDAKALIEKFDLAN